MFKYESGQLPDALNMFVFVNPLTTADFTCFFINLKYR